MLCQWANCRRESDIVNWVGAGSRGRQSLLCWALCRIARTGCFIQDFGLVPGIADGPPSLQDRIEQGTNDLGSTDNVGKKLCWSRGITNALFPVIC